MNHAATSPSAIRLDGVTKRYGSTTALDAVDLEIVEGSLTVIVGPSGCGKSTLLKLISGLEDVNSGRLLIGEDDVTTLAPGSRDIGMVFQDYALYPHMTVEKNIGFGLMLQARHNRSGRSDRTTIAGRVRDVAALLGLEGLLGRKPAQLSGGQRQRVALARAIIRRPAVLLLDEPLSALDAQLRTTARAEIMRLHQEIRSTLVLVTHDQHEALSMATHLVVLRDGRVEQSGTPEELYRSPVNEFVARFVGFPAMNIHRIDGIPERIGWRAADGLIVRDAASQAPLGLSVSGIVEISEFSGEARLLGCRTASGDSFIVESPRGTEAPRIGDPIVVQLDHDRVHSFAENGKRRELASA
jgi:multiple sugar transport system ATP-binding protein